LLNLLFISLGVILYVALTKHLLEGLEEKGAVIVAVS
jgi:hypothetical protein